MYKWVVRFALLLTFCVVLLGGYTRLTEAGLGCPDWPGCYGTMVLPKKPAQLAELQQNYPNIPIEKKKAWTEMAHRYLAGILGLFILGMFIASIVRRRKDPNTPIVIPSILLIGVILQAALGMWTVTLKVLPDIVTLHLLGGMTILSLMMWHVWQTRDKQPARGVAPSVKPWATIGMLVTGFQIFLGAWLSTNYSATACPSFPGCLKGNALPTMHWTKAFDFLHPIGPNYQGGVMDMASRMTIHMAHRFGAVLVILYLLPFALTLIFKPAWRPLRVMGFIIIGALLLQLILGMLNVVLLLPIGVAVAHIGGAALLLLTLVSTIYLARK